MFFLALSHNFLCNIVLLTSKIRKTENHPSIFIKKSFGVFTPPSIIIDNYITTDNEQKKKQQSFDMKFACY